MAPSPSEMAPPAASSESTDMMYQLKQGGKCFGCCCDYRRAVIVLSIISLILGILGIASAFTRQNYGNDLSNDELVDDIDDIVDKYRTGTIVLAIVGFVFAFIALAGAMMFNWFMVFVSALYVIASFIVGIVIGVMQFNDVVDLLDNHNYGMDSTDPDALTDSEEDALETFMRVWLIVGYVIAAIICALFVYPSFCFVKEVRSGIMTKETYPREEHSCCCTSNRR